MDRDELEHFSDELTRKERRQERKILSQKDRSKFKKTAKKQLEKERDGLEKKMLEKGNLLEGKVIKVLPEAVSVYLEGKELLCSLKGALKKEKRKEKNLVVVGDSVLVEILSPGKGVIHWVLARKTVLSRADNLSRRLEHFIAANIDQVLITVSVVAPSLKPPLIDRYIIAAKKGGMSPVIVINKVDLLESEDVHVLEQKALYHEVVAAYKAAQIPVICVSCQTQEGIDELRQQMQGKTSVFSGQSGVGKSSLINETLGEALLVGKTVEKTKKGAHTTTTSQLIPLQEGGFCVDTPGIKSFGVFSLEKEELDAYFSEIAKASCNCQFSDCTHAHEKQCGVREAVEKGEVSSLRYQSYLALLEQLKQEHYRR